MEDWILDASSADGGGTPMLRVKGDSIRFRYCARSHGRVVGTGARTRELAAMTAYHTPLCKEGFLPRRA